VTNFNGKPFMGTKCVLLVLLLLYSPVLIFSISIVVEFAKESRPRRDNFDGDRGGHGYLTYWADQLDQTLTLTFCFLP
jgi:arginine/serine-rich splicing factor 4/5/6